MFKLAEKEVAWRERLARAVIRSDWAQMAGTDFGPP